MTFTATLFGGLLAVIVLFFMARKLALSYYWSSVLAATLPFLAYLGFALPGGFSGDVLAIHLAVFVATAAVLGVFGHMPRKQARMHWAPKLIIAFFVLLALAMAGLLSIAMNGLPDWLAQRILPNAEHKSLNTAFPGSLPHDRNKLYESHMAQMERQRNLGWVVEVRGLDAVKRNAPTQVEVSISDRDGKPVEQAQVTLDLWRIAYSRDDRHLVLAESRPGVYAAQVTFADAGNWFAGLQGARGEDSYVMRKPFVVVE